MKKTPKIKRIKATEILDSRGNPTIETTVWTDSAHATASVPSGASTGIHEALELRDGNAKRYAGLGVLDACSNVNGPIAKALQGINCHNQEQIDECMMELDGTDNKSVLGANAILSVSLAAMRLSAVVNGQELFQTIACHYDYEASFRKMPIPLFNVINGGKHADSGLDIQEYFLVPQRGSFTERLRMSVETYHSLRSVLQKNKMSTSVGDEGGFAPRLKSNETAFVMLADAVREAGYKMKKDFRFGIDAAASEFFDAVADGREVYRLKASKLHYKPSSMYRLYKSWIKRYDLQIIEDGCAEDDFLGWQLMTKHAGKEVSLVGDDLFVTNPVRLQNGIINGIANAVLIKPNQIGTLTETVKSIKLAQSSGYKVVVSHRSGETSDTFISDLSVACGADYIKAGAPTRGERVVKYNRLAFIEQNFAH